MFLESKHRDMQSPLKSKRVREAQHQAAAEAAAAASTCISPVLAAVASPFPPPQMLHFTSTSRCCLAHSPSPNGNTE